MALTPYLVSNFESSAKCKKDFKYYLHQNSEAHVANLHLTFTIETTNRLLVYIFTDQKSESFQLRCIGQS